VSIMWPNGRIVNILNDAYVAVSTAESMDGALSMSRTGPKYLGMLGRSATPSTPHKLSMFSMTGTT
jgi:hypothetical protein